MSPTHHAAARWRSHYLAPTAALGAAGALLAVSLFLPYWKMELTTRAQPDGLRVVGYLGHVEGPVDAVLAGAGGAPGAQRPQLSQLERSLTLATVLMICMLAIAAAFVHNRWAALLSLPAFLFPAVVVADTARWLHPIVSGLLTGPGQPSAAAPPLLLGRVLVGDTVITTSLGAGFLCSLAASLAVAGGLWLHRRAYKPLLDAGSDSKR